MDADHKAVSAGQFEDWENVKARWDAWWRQEIHDRVLINVTAPRSEPRDDIAPQSHRWRDSGYETYWSDPEIIAARALDSIRHTYFGGDALPWVQHGLSVGTALLLGARPRWEHTVWADPAPVAADGLPVLQGWRESPWWRWMREATQTVANASEGRYFVVPTWGNHAADTLASVRGTEQFLLDLVLNRDWLKSAVRTVSTMVDEVISELWDICSQTGLDGSVNYVGCWHSGTTVGFDADVSSMVSTHDFEDVILPPMVESMRKVDRRIFHIDGPGVANHLDALLEIPEIDAYQWVQNTRLIGGRVGFEPILPWIPLIRRVQAKGKSIALYASPDEIEPLLAEVRHEGLLICTHAGSESEAREIVTSVGRLT